MKKIRLTMKLLLFFSLALVLNTSAIPSKAQQTKVSLNLKDKQLTEVLKLIQQQSGFNILYSNELVKNNRMVSLRIDSDDIHEVMRACLQGNALDYEIQNNTIIIKALAAAPQVPASSESTGACYRRQNRTTYAGGYCCCHGRRRCRNGCCYRCRWVVHCEFAGRYSGTDLHFRRL